MNGRTRLIIGCLLAALTGGCDDAAPPAPPNPTPLAESFDSDSAGTVSGRVVWEGDLPRVPRFRAPINPCGDAGMGQKFERSNPFAPVIAAGNRGVVGAVVFLRGVDPRQSRPWDLPPVVVEMCDFNYRVRQGTAVTRAGFVRRGAAVEFVSRQAVFHSLRARGDAFFTLAFLDPGQTQQRVFDRDGVVELSSAAGYFWARAHLFVTEHPYFALTDATGRFTLPRVPPGEYELVCWLPDWHEKERELDADSWQISRLTFRDPVEVTRRVRVLPCQSTEADFTLSVKTFAR